jgi:hypothetical protein
MEASAIDRPDPTIVDFIEGSGLVPRGVSVGFERLPGGISSDIWLVHAGDSSFCVKRALAQLRVAADWRAPIERNTKEAGWIKAVAGFMPEAVPSLLAEDARAGMFAMDYLSPRTFEMWKAQLLRWLHRHRSGLARCGSPSCRAYGHRRTAFHAGGRAISCRARGHVPV